MTRASNAMIGAAMVIGLHAAASPAAGEGRRIDHWAFQPIKRPRPPAVENPNWPRNPIDAFILARLEAQGLPPSTPADRATLIRRLSLDLVGLLPSLTEVKRFQADRRAGAYERLVDRLLASPRYGERWGRHWLDLARYADSNGYTRDFAREMWRYRDWVIDAFNRDLPFDRFTVEQLAGDLLPDATLEQLIATGFHRNTLINEEGGTDDEQFRVDAVADRVDTTSAVFLGLTLGCARCHDHKYDPITQREYYQFFAFLNNADEPQVDAPTRLQRLRGDLQRRDAMQRRLKALEARFHDERAAEFAEKQKEWEASITPEQRSRLPSPVQAALMVPWDERTPQQKTLLEQRFKRSPAARQAFPVLDELARLRASAPDIPTAMILKERAEPRKTYIHKRGSFLDKGERVSPGVPAVLPPLANGAADLNRLHLARWLVAPANPLTARVVVNRLWQRFFGRGIVETENDFGTQGSPPSHPELLDWLASELIARKWSIKAIHRLIVTSATYQQSSRHRPDIARIDPQNRLWARQSRLRLEAEIIRDAALAASGLLAGRIGGPSVFPPQPPGVFEFTQDPKPWKTAVGSDRYRRGMYTHFWRSSPYPALMVFDFPNSNVTCTRRVRSNTPLQALTVANDVTFVECARALARRVLAESASDRDRLRRAFRRCLTREPAPSERERLLALLRGERTAFQDDPAAARQFLGASSIPDADAAERAAWTALARVLLNLDEFITRE